MKWSEVKNQLTNLGFLHKIAMRKAMNGKSNRL